MMAQHQSGRAHSELLRCPEPPSDLLDTRQSAGVHATSHARRRWLWQSKEIAAADQRRGSRIAPSQVVCRKCILIDQDNRKSTHLLSGRCDALPERFRVRAVTEAEDRDAHLVAPFDRVRRLAAAEDPCRNHARDEANCPHVQIITPQRTELFR